MLLTLQLLCCGRVRNLSGSSLLGGKPQVEHLKVRITSVSLHRLPLMTISIINIMSGKCSELAFSVFSVNGKIKEILNETKQQIINKLFVKMFRSHAKLINWLTISALAKIGITNISCAVLMCCDHWAGRVKLRYKIFAMIFQQRSFPMFWLSPCVNWSKTRSRSSQQHRNVCWTPGWRSRIENLCYHPQ